MAKIILATHQKGGVGKSTITFNLAMNIHEKAKVCIVDMDTQGSLTSIKQFSAVPIFPPEMLDQVMSEDYDFIFVDTPPYLSNRLIELCDLASVIIVPTKAGVLDLLAVRSTVNVVRSCRAENKAIVVLNMVKPNTSLTEEIRLELVEYGIKISENPLSDLVAFSRSVLKKGVIESEKAQSQINKLTKEILTMIVN